MVSDLIRRSQVSAEELRHAIQEKSGTALLDFILEDIQKLKKILFDPEGLGLIMTAMDAYAWINEKMQEWLGEKNVADTLTQSVSNNITSQMGLELLDLADIIRPYSEVVQYLQRENNDHFLDVLAKFWGGKEVVHAFSTFLPHYGMRCAGEIDITATRWSEQPAMLVSIILSNIRNFAPDAGNQKDEKGQQEAFIKEQELLERLKQLPNGNKKPEKQNK